MIHKPIQLTNLSLSFPNKSCFEDFSTLVPHGSRIAIIGRNGSGKSTLLKLLQGTHKATSGTIKLPEDVIFGSVPQVIEEFDELSGGQRLNASLTQALSLDPNVLLLDEPTNHLDRSNRKSLMRMLNTFSGTLIVVSHDMELLRNCIDTLWHIDHGLIHVFSGNYDDYMHEIRIKHTSIKKMCSRLNRQKKDMHTVLMKEQKRAAKSRARGKKNKEQRKWPKIVSKGKALQAEKTSARKKTAIEHKKQELNNKLSELDLPKEIVPKFSLTATDGSYTLFSISEGSIGYGDDVLLHNICLSITTGDRIAIMGDNGSGKSTLIKAILDDIDLPNKTLVKTGNWHVPKIQDIGYLDQHYETLTHDHSVFETIQKLMPSWTHVQVRRHLNDFLFHKNEEVNALVKTLSGGEKARLSLAQIAAKTPKLLILDEITNNLDLETREYMIQVLKEYPGAMIVISHDENFLETIGINDWYSTKDGLFLRL